MGQPSLEARQRLSRGLLVRVALVGARSFPANHGGLEVVVEELAHELSSNHDVSVYASTFNGSQDSDVTVVTSWSWKGKYTHTASQMLSGLAQLKRDRHDVVHIHGVGPAFILLLWSRRRRATKVLVTAHGLDWERDKWPRPARAIFRTVALAALRRADAVSAVSAETAASLELLLGHPVSFISNGLRLPPLRAPLVDLPDKYAVVMSRITPEKNIGAVVRAWDDSVKRVQGPLVVIGGGNGSYASNYERDLRDFQNPNVIWLGALPRPDALSILRQAGLFVSMSKIEAQPMSVIEALSLGIPTLLSDIPEHRAVAGDAASYVALSDVDEFVYRLLSPPDLNSRPRDLRRSFWLARDWRIVTSEYVDWYRKALTQIS